jgi:hypothetical protein
VLQPTQQTGFSVDLQFDFGKAKYGDSDGNGFDNATILGYGVNAGWDFRGPWSLWTSYKNLNSYDALSVYPGYEILDPTVTGDEKGVLSNAILDGGVIYRFQNVGIFDQLGVGLGELDYNFTAKEHKYLETRRYSGLEAKLLLDKKLNDKLMVRGSFKIAPKLTVSDSVKGDWNNPDRTADTSYNAYLWGTQWGLNVALNEKMWLETGFSYELLHGEGHEYSEYRFLKHDYTRYGFYALWGMRFSGSRISPEPHPAIRNSDPQPPEARTPEILNPVVRYPDIIITRVNPGEGSINTKVAVMIEGTGFRPGVRVAFTKDQASLILTNLKLVSATQIAADLDLSNAALGLYNITVTNDDGKFGALPDAFIVKQPEQLAPQINALQHEGFNNGSILITLEGPDIQPGITVKIIGPGGVTIPGVIINSQTKEIEAFFNIKDQPAGRYDYYLFYPDGHGTKLDGEFEVRVFSAERYHIETLLPNYFDIDQSEIRSNQIASITNDLAVILKNPTKKIVLGGCTDERGNNVYNLDLSMRRANAVKQYLIEHGVKPERIIIYAYGKEHAKKGQDENIWQNDRRVDVMIYEELGGVTEQE